MVQQPRSVEREPAGSTIPLAPIQRPRPEPRSNLQQSLSVLWRYKWSIVGITLLCLGVALLVSSRQTPIYEGRAKVLVTPINLGIGNASPEEPNLETEAELVASEAVAEVVAKDLQSPSAPRELLEGLAVHRPPDTEILEISYRDPDPIRAQRMADGFAEGYLRYRAQAATAKVLESAEAIDAELSALQESLQSTQRELLRLPVDDPRRANLEVETEILQNLILQRQLARLSLPTEVLAGRVIQPASLPSSPVSPNHPVAGALGIIAGLALATGLAFARERLSGRLRSAEETEEYLGAPMLGSIPQISEWRRRKDSLLVTLGPRRSPAAEAYRMLRTNVLSAASAQGAKSIVVTSALAGEGKSSTVGNLGVVLARAGRHVSLVSADLRRPRLHQFFRCDGLVGLADVLAGRMSLDQVTQEINLPESSGSQLPAVHLRILPTGPVPENPAELLTSETMGKVLADLEASSDIVLIDAPPILAVTDALVVAQLAQAVLVVVGPRSLDRSLVASARQQLDKVGGRILGGVLNGPDRSMTAYGNYASYY